MNWRLMSVFSALVLVGAFGSGCEKETESERKSRRGETCSFTNDCNNTLACVNGICVQDEFPVAVEANSCVLIECRTTDDCCERNAGPSADCEYWTQECERARGRCDDRRDECNQYITDCRASYGEQCGTAVQECGAGSEIACNYISNNCGWPCSGGVDACRSSAACSPADDCELATEACECRTQCSDNRCVPIRDECNQPEDCLGSSICVGGECVECVDDDGCGEGRVCEGGFCIAGCTEDADCPLFSDCVSNHCEYRGCKSNRECVLFTGSGAAVCLDQQCVEPCQANSQCGPLQACILARCTFLGCESNSDCRALAGGRYSPGLVGFEGDIECVDSGEVNESTRLLSPSP